MTNVSHINTWTKTLIAKQLRPIYFFHRVVSLHTSIGTYVNPSKARNVIEYNAQWPGFPLRNNKKLTILKVSKHKKSLG